MTDERDYTHLKLLAQRSKDDSLKKVERAVQQLLADRRDGKLAARLTEFPDLLTQAGFCTFAGLGPNFLNGGSHKKSTKPEVQEFLKNLRRSTELVGLAGQSSIGPKARTPSDESVEISRLERLLEVTRDQLDRAMKLLREQKSLVRHLRSQISPKIVPIRALDEEHGT